MHHRSSMCRTVRPDPVSCVPLGELFKVEFCGTLASTRLLGTRGARASGQALSPLLTDPIRDKAANITECSQAGNHQRVSVMSSGHHTYDVWCPQRRARAYHSLSVRGYRRGLPKAVAITRCRHTHSEACCTLGWVRIVHCVFRFLDLWPPIS